MGFDGKKVVELKLRKEQGEQAEQEREEEESVGGREVGKFWGKNDVKIVVAGLVIFLLGVLILYFSFPSGVLPPREQSGQQQKRQLEPLIPPLLFHQFHLAPRPLPPPERQKRKSATPIHWSGGHHGHHSDGHHGYHHVLPHYYSSPTIIVRPWGYDGYGGGCYGCNYGRSYYEEERRPYFELHRKPNGEIQMRWGFQ